MYQDEGMVLKLVELRNDTPLDTTRRPPARREARDRYEPSVSAWLAAAAVMITGCCMMGTPGPAGIAAGIATIGSGALLTLWVVIINKKERYFK